MSDIVERLIDEYDPLMREAANEIERLRAENNRLMPYVEAFRREEARADKSEQRLDDAIAQVERLRGQVEEAKTIIKRMTVYSEGRWSSELQSRALAFTSTDSEASQ